MNQNNRSNIKVRKYDGFQFTNALRTVVPAVTLFSNGFMFGTIDRNTIGVMGIFLAIVTF